MAENKVDFNVIIVDGQSAGTRIDVLIAEKLELSRSKVQRIIVDGQVVVTDKNAMSIDVTKKYKAVLGDKITVEIIGDEHTDLLAEDIPISIIYEDNDVLIVNKPAGMVVHPGAGNYTGTLVNGLIYRLGSSLSTLGGQSRPGIVHRLDKETSGAIIVAKNDMAHEHLARQFFERGVFRQYECIAFGKMIEPCGEINMPIGRHPTKRTLMHAFAEGEGAMPSDVREAISIYETVEVFGAYSHMRVNLKTGRTHQIRVHLTRLGHPVAGDRTYGAKIGGVKRARFEKSLTGQCLHASKLGFYHPRSEEYIEVESSLPEEFSQFLEKVRGV